MSNFLCFSKSHMESTTFNKKSPYFLTIKLNFHDFQINPPKNISNKKGWLQFKCVHLLDHPKKPSKNRGHCIINPNNALFIRELRPKYHIFALFDPPKIGGISWPLLKQPPKNQRFFWSHRGSATRRIFHSARPTWSQVPWRFAKQAMKKPWIKPLVFFVICKQYFWHQKGFFKHINIRIYK